MTLRALVPLAAPEKETQDEDAEPGAVAIAGFPSEPGGVMASAAPAAVQRQARDPVADTPPGASISDVGVLPRGWAEPAPWPGGGAPPIGPAPRGATVSGSPPGAGPAPIASRLPVARVAAAGLPAAQAAGTTAAESPVVQAILVTGTWSAAGSAEAPAGRSAVQRAVEVGQVEGTVEGGGQAAGGATPAAGASAGGAAGNRDQDLDELARKLYGRIRERLGAELLADRERAGLLVDA